MAEQRKPTTTQIRTFYSEGLSYLTMTFFNTKLSFKFVPFMGKNANGLNQYNEPKAITTTTDYGNAAGLYMAAKEIITNSTIVQTLPIPCNGCTMVLDRRNENGKLASYLIIDKNGEQIQFRFAQMVIRTSSGEEKVIESGLMAIIKTIEGYLTGINADRHLDKLTDDFVKFQESKNNGGGGNNYKGQYKNNGGYNKGQYNKSNYNNGGNDTVPWDTQASQSVSASNYAVQN